MPKMPDFCPRCQTSDDKWYEVRPKRVNVDGVIRVLRRHECGEIVAVCKEEEK